MIDDEGHIEFDPDEVEQIVNWAINSGAPIHLMHDTQLPENEQEMVEYLDAAVGCVETVFHNFPEALAPVAERLAEHKIENWKNIEAQVAEFQEEIKDL